MTKQEERELVQKLRREPPDEDAWRAFSETFSAGMRFFVRRQFPKLRNWDEDIVQESLQRFFVSGVDDFDGGSCLSTYLNAIVRNAALDFCRRKRLPVAGEPTGLIKDAKSGRPIEELESEEAFAAYLNSLTPEQRKTIELRADQEKGNVKIMAKKLGVSPSTLYAWMAQLRKKAQQYLRGESQHA